MSEDRTLIYFVRIHGSNYLMEMEDGPTQVGGFYVTRCVGCSLE